MTIKTIINNIRLRINDEDRYRFSDEQMLTIINEAVRFIRNIFVEEMPMMVAEEPFKGELLKGENVVTVPFDVIKYIDVRCNGKPLHAETMHYLSDTEQEGTPRVFVPLKKDMFAIFPVPQANVKYSVVAVGASVDLVQEDVLPFQSDYSDCVIEYVAMRLSMIDEFDQSVEAQLLGEIRSHIRTKLNDYVPQDHVVRPYY
jgi:hypothetical protein